MASLKKYVNLFGFSVSLISGLIYYLTVEPTASFWDAGEFIATSYTLGIPHPPGAPLFLLLGRLFSFLSVGDPTQIAFWMNMISVIFSALTVLLLYHILILLGMRFMANRDNSLSIPQTISLIVSAFVGAFIFAVSDSFWFSATETEVYAMSLFFTAVVVWAMLKWERLGDSAEENKWLILIAYLMGLSFGVHLLNLLAIPTLGIIYYLKKGKKSIFSLIKVLLASVAILFLLLYGLVGLANVAKYVEIFLVNNYGLPFGSGIILFCVFLLLSLSSAIVYSIKKNIPSLNTFLLACVFVLIGYSSYTLIIVRANHNPPVNQNNPGNVLSFISYVNMDQYPTRPLFYGPYFTAKLVEQYNGSPVYIKEDGKYKVSHHKLENVYDPNQSTILPRLYSTFREDDGSDYREILGLKPNEAPTFRHNIRYLFSHQVGHMYLRYFLWNFAGRAGDHINAGWLTPPDAFKRVPEVISKNRARNNYLMIPLILGLAGMFFTYKRNKENFWIIFSLFFMTGIALVMYINAPPTEPRERDYIYTGSYFAFALWIGFGLFSLLQKVISLAGRRKLAPVAIVSTLSLFVPLLMLQQNWDDHDRTGRYFSVESAKNLLAGCEENAILFTGGDNDSFPLWYVQEVEGFRTDVRVVLLPYFNAEWFIEQNKRSVRDSKPLPLSLENKHFKQGGLNDVIPVVERELKDSIDASQYLELVRREHPAIQIPTSLGNLNYLPGNAISLKVDTEAIRANNDLSSDLEGLLAESLHFKVKGGRLEKKDLMILDLLDTNKWERPIYFNTTSLNSINLEIDDYVVQEGDTFRLLPVKNSSGALVNTDKMYENLMHKYSWRGMDDSSAYYHGYYLMYGGLARSNFNKLATSLIQKEEIQKARKVLNKSLTVLPDASIPYSLQSIDTVGLLLKLDEKSKASDIAKTMAKRADEFLEYFGNNNSKEYTREASISFYALQRFYKIYYDSGMLEEAAYYRKIAEKHQHLFFTT